MQLHSVLVKDFMKANPVTFTPDMDIHKAMKILVEQWLSGAAVIDLRGNLVGLLSETDCLRVGLNAAYHDEWGGTVGDYMTREVKTIEADSSIVEIAELFTQTPYRRYPVLQGNRLVGQLSRRDVMKGFVKLHQQGVW
ncbi:MAG: CBS domain-containing protein [Nitrospirales bacterium]|nr:MAG: CBS domain-containing protein [Nitrospirales bacterium]